VLHRLMGDFRQFLLEYESTLRYHDKLNPVVWDSEEMKPEVRKHLLKVAEAWRDFSNIPKKAVRDVLFTGGNANYNYTKFSDMDVHLLVDKKDMPECDKEVIDDYLRDKKSLWALSHDIKIHGYAVELYAQGVDEESSSDQGVFSLRNDKWVRKPKRQRVNLKDPYIKKKFRHYADIIDCFVKGKSEDVARMEALKERIREMRGSSIKAGGEFSVENLVFKELRNKGYLERLSDYIKNVQDHKLSLP